MVPDSSPESSSDDEDSLPLSQVLGFRNSKVRSPTLTNTPDPSEKFKNGDIVWAEITPRAWSPAKITTFLTSSTALVSAFATNSTYALQLSKVCAFEGNYDHMAKRAGPASSDEIGSALAEVGRRAALGMMCSCRNPDVKASGVRCGFEVEEVLGFVLDLAVCSWVDDDETARAVRLLAQVYGYRHYVCVCRTSEVDQGFHAEDLVGFLKNLAVSWEGFDGEDDNAGMEVDQIVAYRRFYSLRPNWVYRHAMEVEDDLDNKRRLGGQQQDISDSSSVDCRACLINIESDDNCQTEMQENREIIEEQMLEDRVQLNDDFSAEIQEDDCDISQEQMLEDGIQLEDDLSDELQEDCEILQETIQTGNVICMINREDFSIIDLDEEYESVLKIPLVAVAKCNQPDNEASYNTEIVQMANFCDGSSSEESDIDAETACHPADYNHMDAEGPYVLAFDSLADEYLDMNNIYDRLSQKSETDIEIDCNRSFSNLSDNNQEANVVKFLVAEEFKDLSPCHNVNHAVAIIANLSGPEIKEGARIIKAAEHVPPAGCLLEAEPTPGWGDQFLNGPAVKIEEHSSDEIIEIQSSAKTCGGSCTDQSSVACFLESDSGSGDRLSSSPASKISDEIAKLQSSAETSGSCCLDQRENICSLSSSTSQREAPEEPPVKKRRCDQSVSTVSENDIVISCVIAESLVRSDLPESAPCSELPKGIGTNSQTLSSGEERNPVVSAVDDPSETPVTNFTVSTSQTEAVEQSDAMKNPAQFIASDESNLQNTMSPVSGTNSNAKPVTRYIGHVSSTGFHKARYTSKDNIAHRVKGHDSSSVRKHANRSANHQNARHVSHSASNLCDWRRLYVSPLMREGPKSPNKVRKPLVDDRSSNLPKSLHMKFPKDFDLPSKQELEKKFGMFGPLDHSRTKVSLYTGAAQVVFLRQNSAHAASEYVTKKSIFGNANVRFWFDQYENQRKGTQAHPSPKPPPLSLKSCLRKPDMGKKEKGNVRFLHEKQPSSVCRKSYMRDH